MEISAYSANIRKMFTVLVLLFTTGFGYFWTLNKHTDIVSHYVFHRELQWSFYGYIKESIHLNAHDGFPRAMGVTEYNHGDIWPMIYCKDK